MESSKILQVDFPEIKNLKSKFLSIENWLVKYNDAIPKYLINNLVNPNPNPNPNSIKKKKYTLDDIEKLLISCDNLCVNFAHEKNIMKNIIQVLNDWNKIAEDKVDKIFSSEIYKNNIKKYQNLYINELNLLSFPFLNNSNNEEVINNEIKLYNDIMIIKKQVEDIEKESNDLNIIVKSSIYIDAISRSLKLIDYIHNIFLLNTSKTLIKDRDWG